MRFSFSKKNFAFECCWLYLAVIFLALLYTNECLGARFETDVSQAPQQQEALACSLANSIDDRREEGEKEIQEEAYVRGTAGPRDAPSIPGPSNHVAQSVVPEADRDSTVLTGRHRQEGVANIADAAPQPALDRGPAAAHSTERGGSEATDQAGTKPLEGLGQASREAQAVTFTINASKRVVPVSVGIVIITRYCILLYYHHQHQHQHQPHQSVATLLAALFARPPIL